MFVRDKISCKKWVPNSTLATVLVIEKVILVKTLWSDGLKSISPPAFLSQKITSISHSWLVCSTPERVVRVRVLAGDIVLCSWARHFTLMVPLFTHVYKWMIMWMWTSIPSREELKILLVA